MAPALTAQTDFFPHSHLEALSAAPGVESALLHYPLHLFVLQSCVGPPDGGEAIDHSLRNQQLEFAVLLFRMLVNDLPDRGVSEQ
ncbi:MAG: hypothetical protein V3V82_00080 [Acidimicrobiia bacterium]